MHYKATATMSKARVSIRYYRLLLEYTRSVVTKKTRRQARFLLKTITVIQRLPQRMLRWHPYKHC